MRYFAVVLLVGGLSLVARGQGRGENREGAGRWSRARANAWYAKQPWPCGFNYVPANAISYTEMWMPYCFDARVIDKELALAQGVGFNCLRVVLPFVVWEHDPKAFKKRLETFLGVCKSIGWR